MSRTRFSLLRVFAGVALLAASCATAPRPSASPPRMKDSAPERLAAQRAGAPRSLELEESEQRWGFEAAREHRRQQDEAAARAKQDAAAKAVDVTTPRAP